MTASASVGRCHWAMPVATAPVIPVFVASQALAAQASPRARVARWPSTKSWRGTTPHGDRGGPGAVGVLPPAGDVLSAGEDGAGAGGRGPGDGVAVLPGVGGAELQGPVQLVRAVLQQYAYVAAGLGAGPVAGAFHGAGAGDRAGGAVSVRGRVQGAGTRGCLGGRGREEGGQDGGGGGSGGSSYDVQGAAVHAEAFQSGWPGMGGFTAPKSQSRRNGSRDRSPVTSTVCRMKASLVYVESLKRFTHSRMTLSNFR